MYLKRQSIDDNYDYDYDFHSFPNVLLLKKYPRALRVSLLRQRNCKMSCLDKKGRICSFPSVLKTRRNVDCSCCMTKEEEEEEEEEEEIS